MYKKILAIIPARGGSKGIPHKNIYPLYNRPLIEYTIEAAIKSNRFDDVIVSTDDEEIATASKKAGASVPFMRPENISGDHAKTIDVILHAIDYLNLIGKNYDIVVLLQATSPLRNSDDIKKALDFFIKNDIRSMASVNETVNPVLVRHLKKNNQMDRLLDTCSTIRRQDMDKFYCINGAIYTNYVKDLCKNTSLNDNEYAFILSNSHSIDIDNMNDMELAEYYLSKNNK